MAEVRIAEPTRPSYVGRFAPSPTGPLHAGSLVAALGSWLDARAHRGTWLVRIEDTDRPRCPAGTADTILRQLAACGLVPDAVPWQQSVRGPAYDVELQRLLASGWAFPCACTRGDIDAAWARRGARHPRRAEQVYPGTCRDGLGGRPARSVRVLAAASTTPPLPPLHIAWHDRRLGGQGQAVTGAVGDFVVKRADGWWAYQLAVVVDDAAQGVTDVVRGADLADNTPRQIHLQRLLGLPTPRYLHLPLVLGADGAKLSKQNGAEAVDLRDPLAALRAAASVLDLDADPGRSIADRDRWLDAAVAQWRSRWVLD